jgi:hypothetical protein
VRMAWWQGPCREFAPAGDLLSGRPESRQRVAPAKPPLRGSLRCSERGAAPNSLRYAPFKQRGAKSDVEARCARAPGSCASRRFRRGVKEQPTPQQPTAKPEYRPHRGISLPPSEPAEQRKALRACAQRTSSTDFAQLSERSVAKRVLLEPSRPEQRREPRATRGAGGSGVVSLPTFLSTQESRSPARANSGHHTWQQPKEATP